MENTEYNLDEVPSVGIYPIEDCPFKSTEHVRDFVKQYIKIPAGDLPSLFITGPVLSGKTWVASRIALSLTLEPSPRSVRYTTLMDMVTAQLEAKESVHRFYSPAVLFIDNINTDKNAYAPSLLSRVVRHRLDFAKPTVLVSSLDSAMFLEIYGKEMGERVSQMLILRLEQDRAKLERIRQRKHSMLATEEIL